MKKYILPVAVVIAIAIYIVWNDVMNKAPAVTAINEPTPAPATSTAPVATSTPATSTAPTGTGSGQYADGTYTGNVADAFYGNLQVAAVIQGGKLVDVQFLQYPKDQGESALINGRSNPLLKQEAITAQNAQVNIVSGATQSSEAFQQSLASALAQAKS